MPFPLIHTISASRLRIRANDGQREMVKWGRCKHKAKWVLCARVFVLELRQYIVTASVLCAQPLKMAFRSTTSGGGGGDIDDSRCQQRKRVENSLNWWRAVRLTWNNKAKTKWKRKKIIIVDVHANWIRRNMSVNSGHKLLREWKCKVELSLLRSSNQVFFIDNNDPFFSFQKIICASSLRFHCSSISLGQMHRDTYVEHCRSDRLAVHYRERFFF